MHTLRVVVLGDSEAEKKMLLISYTVITEPLPLVFDNFSVTLMIRGEPYTMMLIDTTGTEEYTRLRQLNYPRTDVFLVCFSVVSPSSYENVRKTWVTEIRRHCPNTPFLLVGTMTDLRDDRSVLEELAKHKQRPLRPEDGERLARELGAVKYMECSAKTKEGVKEVFREAVSALLGEDEETKKKKKCVLQ